MQASKFFVTGLPRSRTAWMAAFLSTGETLCYHEPSANFRTLEELHQLYDTTFYKHVGISESGLGFYAQWMLDNIKCKTLVIERDVEDVKKSLENTGIRFDENCYCELLAETLQEIKGHPLVKWVRFESLVHKRVMQDIYWWLMPGMAFDEVRWEQFNSLSIEANMQKVVEKVRKNQENINTLFAPIHEQIAQVAMAMRNAVSAAR